MKTPSRELAYPNPGNGLAALLFGILLVPAGIGAFVVGAVLCGGRAGPGVGVPVLLAGLAGFVAAILAFRSLVIVAPNQSKVVVLFGRYKGTLRKDGFFSVNPFTSRAEVSLR